MSFEYFDIGREEAIWSKVGVWGGIEERERELGPADDSNRFECGGFVVGRLRAWFDYKGFREAPQAADAVPLAFGGELRFGFEVAFHGQAQDERGFLRHRLEHGPRLLCVGGHWACS